MESTIDQKIAKARQLMREVDGELNEIEKENYRSMICQCGHKHSEHGKSYSINYTAGFCSKCKCCHFIKR